MQSYNTVMYGPFQPQPFCHSVILSFCDIFVFKCGLEAELSWQDFILALSVLAVIIGSFL